ncbi:MAG: hypothetical protein AB7N61_24345 [Acidimicrobiia bacterium]
MSECRHCDRCGREVYANVRVLARRRVALIDRQWNREITLCDRCSKAFAEFLAGRTEPDPVPYY